MLARLVELDVDAADIDAILVTHEHSDHIGGVTAISKATGAPIYATHGSIISGKLESARRVARRSPKWASSSTRIPATNLPA